MTGNEKAKKQRFVLHGSLFDRAKIPQDAAKILDSFDEVIFSVRKMNSKQRENLPFAIRSLSHLLTDERSSRRVGYMNGSSETSAYAHYFLWWNLERLVRLFSNLPPSAFDFPKKSIAIDIGSGLLTVPIALWLARPELRKKEIKWYCVDISQGALSFGNELFLAVCAKTVLENQEPWKIVRVCDSLGTNIREKANCLFCANVFNEIVQNDFLPSDFLSKKYASLLSSYLLNENSSIFLFEPGEPKSARFISLMRESLMKQGFFPFAPCPHDVSCPMKGRSGSKKSEAWKNAKWCNFGFSTSDSPKKLLSISKEAGLNKERATLSFLISRKIEPSQQKDEKTLKLRIASDEIRLPLRKIGRYACSKEGLVLAVGQGAKTVSNGDLIEVPLPQKNAPRDEKSGATIILL